jgi:hypothetical protein
MLQNLPYRAKSAYAAAARGVGKGLVAIRVMSPEVPARTHRMRHWGHTLVVVYDSAALAGLDVPWWTYDAMDVVEGWLKARAEAVDRPVRVFEYGSGASTLWLARRVGQIHSVEHHEGFAKSMRPLFEKQANIDFLLRPAVPSTSPKVPSHKPSHRGMDFSDYVATIDEVGGEFDLIVIDGRAREACLTAAIPHLADGGLIVYDNTHRRRYKRAIASSGLVESVYTGLTPTLPYPDRTSLLRKAGTPSPDTA